jgi:site-specific DNA-methyltransferase (adenine-specific)
MKELPENSIDSIVTDPPYGISFMGKAWDNARMLAKGVQGLDHTKDNSRSANQHAGTYDTSYNAGLSFQQFSCEWAKEAFRILKPGGHLLSFSSARTYHRMTAGIEDAGFEIRDQIMWLYGSGFPKSLNIDKAIDKAAGVEREIIGQRKGQGSIPNDRGDWGLKPNALVDITEPATDLAKQWQGWGTALKPAHEPIVVARKPLIGTVVENVLMHGTGGINIDATRVEFQSEADKASATPQGKVTVNNVGNMPDVENDGRKELERPDNSKGRWPANVIHDGSNEVVELFPDSKAPKQYDKKKAGWLTPGSAHETNELQSKEYGDNGSAARFFYSAKTSKRDRNEGLDDFETKQTTGGGGLTSIGDAYGSIKAPAKNFHPTVKPTDLMRYLCKLVTPLNGTVLDPFMGSGSTGKAAVLEGFDFIGIEQDVEYIKIAEARIAYASKSKEEFLF